MSLFRSLHYRPFAFLWFGQSLSRVGDFLYEIALAWWVLQKTGSAEAMSAVLILSFTPMLLFLLIGGVAVDRFPRLRVILISDVLRGIIVLSVAVLAATDQLGLGQVYLASLLFGFVDAFFQPAFTAVVPDLVPDSDLPSANSLTSLSLQAGRILGPALGAVIVSVAGPALAFGLNSLSFFLAAILLLPVLPHYQQPPRPVGTEAKDSVVRDVREGFGTVLHTPWLWITILLAALTNVTLAGPYSVALPFLVKDVWHAGVETLGLLYAVFPIGYVVGGIWLGRMQRIRQRGLLAYGAIIVAGLGLLTIGLPLPLFITLIAAFFNGASMEAFGIIWTTTMQELTPREQLGRVASIDALGSFALLPIGYGLAGRATEQFGAAWVCVVGGGLTALFAAVGLLHPAIRHLDYDDSSPRQTASG